MSVLMVIILMLALASLPITFQFWLKKTSYSTKEKWIISGALAGITAFICCMIIIGGHLGKTVDIEIWNGKVESKSRDRVSCSHSYSCNCRSTTSCSGSGSSRSCSTSQTCDTCYEHSYDVDWNVQTTIGNMSVDRIDRQGVDQPPRWTIINQGDPVSKTHHYINYFRGTDQTIQRVGGQFNPQLLNLIPPYPDNIYDIYKINRVLPVRFFIPDEKQWNNGIAMMLRDLGPAKQVNVVVVMIKTDDPNYEYALRQAWVGGKKNDVIIIFGVPEYPKIQWVSVIALAKNEMFKVKLRDDLLAIENLEGKAGYALKVIESNIHDLYQRKPMADFEYLKDDIYPDTWVIVIAILLTLILPNLGAWWLSSRK